MLPNNRLYLYCALSKLRQLKHNHQLVGEFGKDMNTAGLLQKQDQKKKEKEKRIQSKKWTNKKHLNVEF